MQLEVLKKSKYEVMAWKNGLGTTAQIDIFPRSAPFPGDDFHWRLSSATVATDSSFSQFSECERWLIVWQGEGFFLNDVQLTAHVPLHFSGEKAMHCRLIKDEVIDVGLIFRPAKVRAEFTVEHLEAAKTSRLELTSMTTYLFCAKGQVSVGKELLESGDTLKVSGAGTLSLCSEKGASFYLIKLFDA